MTRTAEVEGWVLWGSHPKYAGGSRIKLTSGALGWCRRELAERKGEGFADLGIVK